MSSAQPNPTGEKQPQPLQILVYTPQSASTKGPPQTSEVFDASGSKNGAGGGRVLEFINRNGETLRIPEYTTHIIRPPRPSSSTPRKFKGQYRQPVTTTPTAPIYPHHHHYPCPDRFLHLYLSHEEPSSLLPPPPPPIPPPPQQPPEFAMTTMAIPPISEEEWNMLNSPEPPPEMFGLNLGYPTVTEELLESCLPVDSTDEGRQWWHELLSAEGDGEEFWTRFLGSDGGVAGGEAGWGVNGEGEMQRGCAGFDGGPES